MQRITAPGNSNHGMLSGAAPGGVAGRGPGALTLGPRVRRANLKNVLKLPDVIVRGKIGVMLFLATLIWRILPVAHNRAVSPFLLSARS